MALRSVFGCTAIAMAGASFMLVLAPAPANAQDVDVYPAAPPPPPPPPPAYYYQEHRGYRPHPPEPDQAFALGFDFEGAVPFNVPQVADGNNLAGGSGIKVRIGDQIRVTPWFRVTPEVGYGYAHLFASSYVSNSYAWDMNRMFAGIRLAFGRVLVPSIYGHVGYGWRTTGDPEVNSANGIAVDVGGALDIRIVRQLQFGVHAEWVTIDAQPYAPEWIAMGGHVDLAF